MCFRKLNRNKFKNTEQKSPIIIINTTEIKSTKSPKMINYQDGNMYKIKKKYKISSN